jgi:uncharacterized protein YjbI with pentapeptide repeats
MKPMKVATLFRPFVQNRKPELHIAAILGFPLGRSRALLDEIALWPAMMKDLGEATFDEGLSKPGAEVLVAGRCFAPGQQPAPVVGVRVKVGEGDVDKRLAILGDRHWRSGGPSQPTPFVEMPIDWKHAFGGPSYELNPYGVGMPPKDGRSDDPVALPNVETPEAPLTSPNDRPRPAGLSAMDPSFGQRRRLAGTFGSDYADRWAPGLPGDHDPRFFHLAPDDQRVPRFWKGNESFLIENMNADEPRIEGRLPGLAARAFVSQQDDEGDRFREVSMVAETLWLFPTSGVGALIFRGRLSVRDDDAADITDLLLACEDPADPRPLEHYRNARARRLDKDKGALADMTDTDIMPSRASGVAPNIDLSGSEMGQWTRLEGFERANNERGRKRMLARQRQLHVDSGGDPSVFDRPEPAEPEVPDLNDLDAIAEFLVEQEEAAKDEGLESASAEKIQGQIEASARSMGIEEVPVATDDGGGPPTFRAQETLDSMRVKATEARASGAPSEALEAQLADPELGPQLLAVEQAQREAYLVGAHMSRSATPMTAEQNQLARVVFDAAATGGEPLSDRDFTGADLRGLDLTGVDLRRSFLECADLRGVDLSGANLADAVLTRADLRGANLARTRLVGANLGGANLEGASLEDADLEKATMMGARVDGACFTRANLSGADLLQIDWVGVDLRAAKLQQCSFVQANLSGVDFSGADLFQSTFLQCTLDGADFSDANLGKATFVACKGKGVRFNRARCNESVFAHQDELPEADFTDAHLEPCCLRTTNFAKSRFDRARMTMADLSECDLSSATFEQTNLKSALLIGAKLDGASLRGANLLEAIVTKASLRGADFTGAQCTRADFSRSTGDQRTRFDDAVVKWARFDKEGTSPR